MLCKSSSRTSIFLQVAGNLRQWALVWGVMHSRTWYITAFILLLTVYHVKRKPLRKLVNCCCPSCLCGIYSLYAFPVYLHTRFCFQSVLPLSFIVVYIRVTKKLALSENCFSCIPGFLLSSFPALNPLKASVFGITCDVFLLVQILRVLLASDSSVSVWTLYRACYSVALLTAFF